MPETSPHPITLSGELSLRNAAELRIKLWDALAGHASIALETDLVDSADAGILQLLVAAQKSAAAAGKTMTLAASAGRPFGKALLAVGFIAADGRPLIPEARSWTLTSEAA